MLLPITPVCSSSKVRRDGTSLIFIQYCRSAEDKKLMNTGLAIPPNYWHAKHKRISEKLPESYGKAEGLNKELQRQIRLAEDVISFAIEKEMADPVQFAKTTFKPNFDVSLLEKATKNNTVAKPRLTEIFFSSTMPMSHPR